jgi:hypothetical protein
VLPANFLVEQIDITIPRYDYTQHKKERTHTVTYKLSWQQSLFILQQFLAEASRVPCHSLQSMGSLLAPELEKDKQRLKVWSSQLSACTVGQNSASGLDISTYQLQH